MNYHFFMLEGEGAKAVVWARDAIEAREAATAMSWRFQHAPLRTYQVFDPTEFTRPHVLMCATEDNVMAWGR